MSYTLTDRALALAGIFQAARLVKQVANTGNIDQAQLETSVQSILSIDVDKAENAFGGVDKLTTGLRTLIEQLGGRDMPGMDGEPKDLMITKYVAGVLVLERRLMKNPQMLNTISSGIERARNQVEHFGVTHENVIASLAHTYTQTISNLKPRIMVQGEHVYIANDHNANTIRTLLLGAIRAAVLWRQCGGTRWQLFFQRQKIVDEAKRLLKNLGY